MANMIEIPVVDWTRPENKNADRIAAAFYEQVPIEIDGQMCIVTDFQWPKGSDRIEYRTRPA